MACANLDRNKKDCSCKYTNCARHGICCECVAYHRANGGKPGCMQKPRGKDARNQS